MPPSRQPHGLLFRVLEVEVGVATAVDERRLGPGNGLKKVREGVTMPRGLEPIGGDSDVLPEDLAWQAPEPWQRHRIRLVPVVEPPQKPGQPRRTRSD